MEALSAVESTCDVKIEHYHMDDFYKTFPQFKNGFLQWSSKKHRKHEKTIAKKLSGMDGVLLAQNHFGSVLGMLIYSSESVDADFFERIKSFKNKIKVLCIENLISNHNYLQKQIFLSLLDGASVLARRLDYMICELPDINEEHMFFIKKKYGPQQLQTKQPIKNLRCYIDFRQ